MALKPVCATLRSVSDDQPTHRCSKSLLMICLEQLSACSYALTSSEIRMDASQNDQNTPKIGLIMLLIVMVVVMLLLLLRSQDTTLTFRRLHQDVIINADLWSAQPEILSAGFGFDGIIGVDGGETEIRAAGGTWNQPVCTNGQPPSRAAQTSSSTPTNVAVVFDRSVQGQDGLPVVFSYPVLPSTVNHTDFLVTLNTGETLTPQAAGIFPNYEYNERHVVVIFGDFGNRLLPDEDGARYTVNVEVVADATPLTLLGPEGVVSAVGLFKKSDATPYASGPYLVGAKLNHFSPEGEGGPGFLSSNLPNDGYALYGDAAQYRLRVYTSGGFSPDGVRGVLPSEFARYFRLHVTTAAGETIFITEDNMDYTVDGGRIRVLGLADLGLVETAVPYDDCYIEDHDNYIDIILNGDEAAIRQITFVEIPASDGYDPFYNPGGPGMLPTAGVRYTAPGPRDLEPVIMALDDPMTVTLSDK